MANLTVQSPYNPNRPTDPRQPNGIAHATSANPTDTKADRATAKLAWAEFVDDYKTALKNGSPLPSFSSNTITYTGGGGGGGPTQITSYGYSNFVGTGPSGTNVFHINVDPNQVSAIISASSWTIYEMGNSNQSRSMTYSGNDGSNTLYFNVGSYSGWQTDTFWYTP